MSAKDPAKKTKRPDMAIYTPRGRRSQDETKKSPDGVSQPQPAQTAPRKDRPPAEHTAPPLHERADTERSTSSTTSSQSRAPTAERSRETPAEPSQHRAANGPAQGSRGHPGEGGQPITTRVFTAKNRERYDDFNQRRTHRTSSERSRGTSEGSDRAPAVPQSKDTAGKAAPTASVVNGLSTPKTQADTAPETPPAERKPNRTDVRESPASDERPIDLTVKPVDLSVKPATDDSADHHGDKSSDSRRRPRGAAGVYVPRAARRHHDSGGEPARPPDVPPESKSAGTGRGDAAHTRHAAVESSAGPDRPKSVTRYFVDAKEGPRRNDGGHRRRDSERSTGDGERKRTTSTSSASDVKDRRREPVKKDPPFAVVAPSPRDGGTRTFSRASAAGDGDSDPPPARIASRSEPRQRPMSPPRAEMAAVALDPPVPAVRRSLRTDSAERVPSSGLLYVPGGPRCDPPEPPPSAYPQPYPQPYPQSYPQPTPQPPRLLFDPNNPNQALEVTPRAADARDRRHQETSRSRAVPRGGPDPTASAYSDTFSLPSNSTNANRISQLLGRSAGDVEYMIACAEVLSNWDYMKRIRIHVTTECVQVLIKDLRTWMTLGIDQTIWKSFYYCVMEELRTLEPAGQEIRLREIIDEGSHYFTLLLTHLEQTYDIPVWQLGSLYVDPEPIKHRRYFSSVAALSQRLLLCLGDLTRYQHQLGRLPNLMQSHQYYLQAQKINPKNGRPFNQLAIIALYMHRRLDCVYLYARALMAANPFHTARESLLSLFHESSRRYAAHSPMPGQARPEAAERKEERRGADLRMETWVHPGRGDRRHRTLHTAQREISPERAELKRTSDDDLTKAFTTTYLHVQGKLYTRVSLESYQEDACVMLRQFSEMLHREPMPLTTDDMLHILGINMFNIANTKLKDERLGSDLRSTYQELALAVAIEMAGHVIQRACQLLSARAPDGGGARERLFKPSALETCMVFVKVWCDWLLSSSAIWNPPPCTADYRVCGVADCWSSLAELTNLLRQRDGDDERNRPSAALSATSTGRPGEVVVRLPEDIKLESFTPLLCGENRLMFVDQEVCSVERARDLLRLRCVLFVTEEFLCGTEPEALRLIKTSDGACHYVSQVSSHAPVAEPDGRAESPDVEVEWSGEDDREEDVIEEDDSGRRLSSDDPPPPLSTSDSTGSPRLVRLQQQKLALERHVRRQEAHSRRVQAIVSSAHVSVTLEVRPRYLVADTNAYVDYLEELQSLVGGNSVFTLTVPVTVLAELDGLSRPGDGGRPRPGQSEEHVRQVRKTARAALAFVQQRGAPHVRCVTSRGHLLASAVFTAEDDDDEQATNDDRILSCCRNLERGVSEKQPDGGQHLTREVVLLTDDRNLRLKALSMDVPTRTVPDFVAWAS